MKKDVLLTLEQLVAEKFSEEGFVDCFLVELKLSKSNALTVFIDADSGITFEKCRVVSRFLEGHIDANSWLGETYSIDVSSPGIDRPLSLLRQYQKNVGRKLEVTRADDTVVLGQLVEVSEDQIVVEAKMKLEGEKKASLNKLVIPFVEIKKAVVQVTW